MTQALVLAAGLGRRGNFGMPKGFIEFNETTLIESCLRILQKCGVHRVTIVTGFQSDRYEQFAEGKATVDVVFNENFMTSGSLESLRVGLKKVDRNAHLLVLESDVWFVGDALNSLLGQTGSALLASGPTGAGDEVWIECLEGQRLRLSKSGDDSSTLLQYTGIFYCQRDDLEDFVECAETHAAWDASGDYERAIEALSERTEIRIAEIAADGWCEVDTPEQLARMRALASRKSDDLRE